MTLDYNDNSQNFDEFAAAKKQFMFLTVGIQGKMKGMEHSDMESLLDKEGKELLRCILQGHLDRLSLEEPVHENVIGPDGMERRQRRTNTKRQLMTVFGEVIITRIRYGRPGKTSLHSLDFRLSCTLPASRCTANTAAEHPDSSSRSMEENLAEPVDNRPRMNELFLQRFS